MMTALLGLHAPGFEGWALLALALVAYLVALIEAQVEVLALALFIGVLALAAGASALGWTPWQALLAFVALSWLYTGGQWFWGACPGCVSAAPSPGGPIRDGRIRTRCQ